MVELSATPCEITARGVGASSTSDWRAVDSMERTFFLLRRCRARDGSEFPSSSTNVFLGHALL